MLRVLVVCTANVCRSQYARMLLLDGFVDHPELSRMLVQSGGTVVSRDSEPCSRVLRHFEENPVGVRQWPTHPRAVSDVGLDKVDLILTAESAHRATMARLAPALRERTFTIREANHYLLHARQSGRLADIPEGTFAERFRWVIARLHGSRGQFPITAPAQRRFARASSPIDNGVDIPDGHDEPAQAHEKTLSIVRDEIARLSESLCAVL